MIGNIFEIGFTKKGKMPILIHLKENKIDDDYVDVFYRLTDLLDISGIEKGHSSLSFNDLLNKSKTIFQNQTNSEQMLSTMFINKNKIKSTGIKFIPVRKYLVFTENDYKIIKYENSRLTNTIINELQKNFNKKR